MTPKGTTYMPKQLKADFGDFLQPIALEDFLHPLDFMRISGSVGYRVFPWILSQLKPDVEQRKRNHTENAAWNDTTSAPAAHGSDVKRSVGV